MTDIDIEFYMNGRDDVIRYAEKKYGSDNVGQIITFGTMKARAVIRDVGRVLNIPYGEVDKIAKMVPEGPRVKLDKAIEDEPELKNMERGEDIELVKKHGISKIIEEQDDFPCVVISPQCPLHSLWSLEKDLSWEKNLLK